MLPNSLRRCVYVRPVSVPLLVAGTLSGTAHQLFYFTAVRNLSKRTFWRVAKNLLILQHVFLC